MKKRLYLNATLSLVYQVIAIINGLFIPRMILSTFGSAVNGLTSSITQMLSVISFLDLGVGSVVQVGLYGPLAHGDNKKLSEVYAASVKYFNVIAKILLGYVVVLCFYYSAVKETNFSPLYNVSLILALSISSLAQYFFGINNTLLLNADQKIYIVTTLNIITTIINAFAVIVCIRMSMPIQVVKLASSMIFLMKPFFMSVYVKKNYKIEKIKNPPRNVLKNKWSGMIQHITTALANSIDYLIMTLFADMRMISVYTVYVLPLNSIKQLIDSLTNSYKSFFGNLLVNDKKELLNAEFRKFELLFHFFIVTIFVTLSRVLVPFVLWYTRETNDVNYVNTAFCVCILLAYAFYCLRIPYTTIIFAAGHFKETQLYCIIEIIINITISIGLYFINGIVGIAVGTFISAGYRMIASAYYLRRNIIQRSFRIFIKQIMVDVIAVITGMIVLSFFSVANQNFFAFVLSCIVPYATVVVITIMIYITFFFNESKSIIEKIIKRRK